MRASNCARVFLVILILATCSCQQEPKDSRMIKIEMMKRRWNNTDASLASTVVGSSSSTPAQEAADMWHGARQNMASKLSAIFESTREMQAARKQAKLLVEQRIAINKGAEIA